jgi:hypothetical protein
MELLQGFAREDGVGVEDLKRWPASSKAVSFLSETTSTTSLSELLDVCIP